MSINTKEDITIKHLDETEDTVVMSDKSVIVDIRSGENISVKGDLKIKSGKDTTIIGDGIISSETDNKIKRILKDEDALGLYESNKKYGPTVIFTEEEYSVKTSKFVIKKGTVVSKGVVVINASDLEVTDSVIAAAKTMHLKGMEEVKCENSYIGSAKIYIDHFSVLPSLVQDCKIEGELHFLDLNFNYDEL